MAQDIVTERNFPNFPRDNNQGFDPNRPRDQFDPRVPQLDRDYEDYEERYPKQEYEFTTEDYIFLSIRCFTLLVCLLSIILVLVNIGRGNRLKSWRLYVLVSLSVFCWIAMSLYQDHIDYYFVQEVTRYPQPRSIYWCFRNFVHGLTLYLIILLLAHLSDMQHRSHWLGLIAVVILVPLVYSVGLLIVDLRVNPDVRHEWYVSIAIDSVRIFLYNIVTTILILAMSRSFCTRRLYGTYSEKRSKLVVIVARWTFAFLLIQNFVSIASYAVRVISRVPSTTDILKYITIHRALDEATLLLTVLAVPLSYLVASCASCCCGLNRETDMEMDKMDKIYNDVWTTQASRSSNPNPTTNTTSVNSSAPGSRSSSRNGSTTQLDNAPRAGSRISSNPSPGGRGMQNGVVARRPRHDQGSNSSVDTVGSLPSIGMNPGGASSGRRSRARESYMEAMSTGSLDDERGSMKSTEPIDL